MKLVNNVQHKLTFAQKGSLWHGDPCHSYRQLMTSKLCAKVTFNPV